MTNDWVVRVAVWLVERSGGGAVAEALAGDVLESFAAGCSRWWCLAQGIRRAADRALPRVRALVAAAAYSAAFVLLHPAWQRSQSCIAARLPVDRLSVAAWPGTAVAAVAGGLVPAVGFVWVGVLLYVVVQGRMFGRAEGMRVALALSWSSCVVSAETMLRLGGFQHELQAMARADFYYPLAVARFSVPLFLGLLAALVLLSRGPVEGARRRVRRMAGPLTGAGVVRSVGMLVLLTPQMAAQAPAAGAQDGAARLMAADGEPLEFDVVSVKPNRSGATAMNIVSPPMSDGVTITNMPVETILQWAYGISLSDEMAGVPEWARKERYDVTAKVSAADVAAFRRVTDPVQRAPMLQKILVDRFGLKFHSEMKELPVYALVVGKDGVRMTEIQPAMGANGMKEGGGRQMGPGMIRSMGQPMKPLVDALTRELRRMVIDRTGLAGYYNFTLRWAPEDGAATDDGSAPSIFTAVQEQLGLKLEPARAQVRVLVVDRLERPAAD
jgi:uncharacterized protein (TIGR03435 family)